jgi:hypothetical protein
MSSKTINANPKVAAIVKKKSKEEQLLEALDQARVEAAESVELAGLDTSNMVAAAPAATATDAAVSSTASTTGSAAASTAAAGTTAAVSTGVIVAGVAGAAVVVASSGGSSSNPPVANDTTAPNAPSFSLATDSGASNSDLITNVGTVNISGLESGATWQYTLDSTAGTPTWETGTGTSVTLTGNATSFAVRQTDAAGNTSTASTAHAITLDTTAPTILPQLSANGTAQTVTLTYSEPLDATNIPATTAFAIQVNGVANAVTQVVANGATLVLTLANAFTTGQTVSVTYTDADGDGTTTIQDAAGNDAIGFTSGVVADGYIRDAQMFLDAPSGLVEIVGVKTDANGNFFMPAGSNLNGYALVAVGGVNIDTGLPNTTQMKAPAGSTTINPLTTLVQAVVESSGVTAEVAAGNVATALGLDLGGGSLLNYDPLSATAGNPVAAQKAAAQIATLTTLAAEAATSGGGQAAATSVLTNIANVVANNASVGDSSQTVSLADTSVLNQALSGVTLSETQQAAIVDANTAIAAATNITAISTAQSQFVDKIAPNAPTTLTIASLTKDNTPSIEVGLDATSLNGNAAVTGDTLVIFDGNNEVATVVITAAHLAAGKVVVDLAVLSEGSHLLTAKLTDKAGNTSDLRVVNTVVDTTAPTVVLTSATDNLAAGATTTLTMTFSEALTGLTAADLQVTGGGSVSNLVKVSDTVYTSTYTAPTTGGAGSVQVVAEGYTDIAGNTGAVSNALNLATVNPPVVTINALGGADKVISGQTGDNVITGTAQANNGVVTIKAGDNTLGTATATNGTWSYVLTPENLVTIGQGGNKEITAEQTRTVSNTDYKGTATAQFSVDTQAPSTLTINDVSGNNAINAAEKSAANGVAITGTAEAGVKVELTFAGVTKSVVANGEGVWSYPLTNADYKAFDKVQSPSISAVAIDAAGNKSAAVIKPFAIDTVAPIIGLVELSENTDTGIKGDGRTSNETPSIEFKAEIGSFISISVDGGKNYSTETATETVNVQSLTLPNLPEGSNTITLKAVDTAGNESIRTTSILIDSTAPSITNSASNVAENAGDNKVVYKPTTKDASVVSYAFKAVDDVSSFTIDTKTGEVTLKNSADFETKPSYTFTVVATDAAGNSSEKAVTLNVTNVNEAPTAVTLNGSTATLAENTNTANPIKVANITVADDALGLETISLTGADAAKFEVIEGALFLKAGAALDFEAKEKYDVTVNVVDTTLTGSTPLTANYSLSVSDVNEAPTAVTLNNKLATVAENTTLSARMKVADISITDDALGSETISLTGADEANFEVIEGALYLKAGTGLNFEAQNKYDVTVNVADAALTGSTSVTTDYSLSVSNVNEAPMASNAYQSAKTIVNGQASSGVTFVPDFIDPENDNLTFSISSGTTPPGLSFNNGVVTGTPTTDGSYTFTVRASDGSLTHAQEYTVSVVSAPVIQSMTITDATGNSTAGKQGDNLTITLNLSEAVDLGLQSTQPLPTIMVNGAEQPFSATFVSQSIDGKSLSFSATAPSGNTSNLSLQSINLNGATITGKTTNVPLITAVNNLNASYALDNTPPADAAISIGGSDSVLNATEATNSTPITITPEAGATIVSVMVNQTSLTANNNAYTFNASALSQGNHTITIVTQDAAGNIKTTTKAFSVDTLAPQMTSGSSATSIDENTGANQIIYTAASADTTAKFSLKTGGDSDLLSIDANTGEVKLLANPNYEVKPSYSFTVVATDAAGNTSEQPVSLAIINVNDAPTGSVTITGSSVVGQTLTATNTLADEDGMGTVAYQWLAGDIVLGTGTSYTLKDTDANKSISVSASYTDGFGTEAVTSVAVTVTNLPPLFGGLLRSESGGYEFIAYGTGLSKFVAGTSGLAWTSSQTEEVIGLTQHYTTAGQTYYDVVVKEGTTYSTYSFTQSTANPYQYALVSPDSTPLTAARIVYIEMNWNTALLGSSAPVADTNAVLTSLDGLSVKHYSSNNAFVVFFTNDIGRYYVLQNTDGTLWQPAQGTTPKALAYNPINDTVNYYYTESGIAKVVSFTAVSGLATAGTVNTMGDKGIAAAESYLGVDLNGNGLETVTVQAKWAVQNNYNIYFVKTTNAAGNGIFGLVEDYPNDNVTLTNGQPLSSFMKLFKTNDGETAWTPGSTDLSVKAASYNSVTKQYDVLLQSTSTKAFSMWSFGMDGNATTTDAQKVSKTKLYAFEQGAYQDLNGDGAIGTTYQVDITSAALAPTLQNVQSFTPSTGWKISGDVPVEFSSATAGTVTTQDGTVPFTLTNGAIVFDLGAGSTASYKLLAGNDNMMVIGTTDNNFLKLAMNQDASGPNPVMAIYKEAMAAPALPTGSVTLYNSSTYDFGDNYQPVSIKIDPATSKITFTDIWGLEQTTSFTVTDGVIAVDMAALYGSNGSMSSGNSMKLKLMGEANGFFLIKSEKVDAYQQATTTETNIKTWFESASGMNNKYQVYGDQGAVGEPVTINWTGTATFTADGKTYTVTNDATKNSIKFQHDQDYYEEYSLVSGTVIHSYTNTAIETWSSSAVYNYAFTPDLPPSITIDTVNKTATVSNIEEGTNWQYQINNGSAWQNGTGSPIDLSSYSGYVSISVKQSDVNDNYNSSGSEYGYNSAYFTPPSQAVITFTPFAGTAQDSSDASTAIVLDTDYMIVGDDEAGMLRVYPREGGAAVAEWSFIGTDKVNITDELDVEASVKVGDTIFFTGSHSNGSDGAESNDREFIFAVKVTGTGADTQFSYQGKISGLEQAIATWDHTNVHGKGFDYFGITTGSANGVAPEQPIGFSIEGLTASPDGAALWLGMRAPQLSDKALIVSVENYKALLAGTSTTPSFGAPIELALGGRGIRSIEKAEDGSGYLIIAGPAGSASAEVDHDFRFFTWTGDAKDAPIALNNNLDALRDTTHGSWETIAGVSSINAGAWVQILQDNGDTIWDGQTKASKKLAAADQKFQGQWVQLGAPVNDTDAPLYEVLKPADMSVDIVVDSNFEISFNEAIKLGNGNFTIKKASDDSTVETIAVNSANVSISYNKVTINPSNNLDAGTAYYIEATQGVVVDHAGNQWAGLHKTHSTQYDFTTKAATTEGTKQTLIISEVNSNATGGDFFELYNYGTTAIDLTGWKWIDDAANPTHTDARDFGVVTSLAAGAKLIVITDSLDIVTFKSNWGLDSNVLIITGGTTKGPGLGKDDGVVVFNAAGQVVTAFNYDTASIIASDGTVITTATASEGIAFRDAQHAGTAYSGTGTVDKSSVVWDGLSTSNPTYKAAVAGQLGSYSQATVANGTGSPGLLGNASDNHQPTFSPSPTGITETIAVDSTEGKIINVINLLAANNKNASDVDGDSLGIAIIKANLQDGDFTYSEDSGATWVSANDALAQVSGTNALLVSSTNDSGSPILLKFVAKAGLNQNNDHNIDSSDDEKTDVFQFKIWDGNAQGVELGTTGLFYANTSGSSFNTSSSFSAQSTWAKVILAAPQLGTSNSDNYAMTSDNDLLDLTLGGSDKVELPATVAGKDTINGFSFAVTTSGGDRLDLSAFLGDTYGVADANTTTSGMQAFAGSSTDAVNIDNQVALVSGITDAIATGNGLSDDIAALFGSAKTFAGLAEGHKAAVLVQGADSTSATLWYATGNANGTVTAQQVANMTNIGSLSAISQENFYNPIL